MAGYVELNFEADPDGSIEIHFKASKTDNGGLLLDKPIILMRIEQGGNSSPWIDAERVQDMVSFHKQGLIDKLEG